MSDLDNHIAYGFQSIVADAQRNELEEEAKRFNEERAAAAALRKANNPLSINPTELLGIRTEEELQLELDGRLYAETKAADKAAAEHEKEDKNDVTVRFPAPTLTR